MNSSSKPIHWLASAGGLVLMMVLLAACAPAAPVTVIVTEIVDGEVYAVEVTAAASRSDSDEEFAEFTEEAVEEGEESGGVSDAPNAIIAPQPQNRMIIKNGELDLLVENADTGIDRITQIALDNGGYVLTSQVYFEGDYKAATITIGVRSEQFETAMRRLRETALEVQRENATGEDVTSEFVDLESRLRNLEATRDRIKTFLEDAKDVDEALRVNNQLSEIETEIEVIRGRMEFLSGRSAYSLITVNLSVPQPTPTPTLTPTPTPPPTAWSPQGAMNSAVRAQTGLLRGLVEAVIWLGVVFAPYGIVLAAAVFGTRAIWRRVRRNNRDGTS